jgi:3'-phosphoadenosine 5'-phosphosulfate sulfotransferase (PAPS reductase)/FAD synthetase
MKVQDLGFSDKNSVDMFPGRAQEVTKAPKEDIVHQTVAAGADGHDPTIPIIEVTIKPFRGEKAWLRRLSMVDYLNWHDRVFIGYSGGKDSFATLIWCLENVEREKINVFYSNLGWGVDWPHAIAYVFATEKMIGKRIFISGNANPHLFEQELLEMNYPHPASCWLRNKFKLPHVKGYYAQEKIGPKYGDPKEKVCHVLGVRWAEDATREKTYPDRGILEGMHYASPLIGWKDTDIVKFLGDRNLKIISAYATTNRLGCFMCPNAGRQEGINSRKKYPKLWKRVLEWIAMGARSDGRVANFHLVKYLTSLDDIPPEEKRARFDSFYSGSCFGIDEEEDWLEELFDSPLPTRPYLTIPYDPNLHPFRCDLKSEYLEMGEKDTETEVSLCML